MGNDGHQHGLEIQGRADRPTDFTKGMHFFDRARQCLGAHFDLLLQIALRVLQSCGGTVELVGKSLELVASADVDAMIEVAPADACRTVLQLADRRDHPAGQRDARQDCQQKAQRQHRDAARRGIAQRGEGILDRPLDEHEPAERRNRRVNGDGLATLQALGNRVHLVVRRGAGALRARRPDLWRVGEVALREHEPQIGMGDELVVRIHHIRIARTTGADARHHVPDRPRR